jgi:hypothetical protein
MKTRPTLHAIVLLSLMLGAAVGEDKTAPMNKTFVNAKGELEGKLVYTTVQLGGFAGSLGASVVIDPSGEWTGARAIGGRKTELKGKLTPAQIKSLGETLAKHDLASLPKVIGSKTVVTSPRNIADGASTTVKLQLANHQVVSNSADGVDATDEEIALRMRLTAIGNAIQELTLNAAAEQ